MTWGTSTTNNEKPPIQAYSPESGEVPVQGSYDHLPQKSVLAVGSLTLISGILCIILGIANAVLLHGWEFWGVGCGIFFAITGILGLVSVHRTTKGRLVGTGVLSIISTLIAVSAACDTFSSFCSKNKGYGRHDSEESRHLRGNRGSSHHGHDGGWKEHRQYRKMKALLGLNIVYFLLCLLVFCCAISLAVFALRTVTSPKNRQRSAGPVVTPVVAFPPSKDPTPLDTFNGN